MTTNRRGGFTLVELLISVAILAYCLSPMLSTYINGTALNDASRNHLQAVTHAEFVMESIKNTAFASIPGTAGTTTWAAWTFDTSGVTALGLRVLKNETITTTLTGANPVDISVTVSWSDSGGRSRLETLRTLISG